MTNWNVDEYYKSTYTGTGMEYGYSLDTVNLYDEVINDIKKIENGFVSEHPNSFLDRLYLDTIAYLIRIKEELLTNDGTVTAQAIRSPFDKIDDIKGVDDGL